MEVQQLETFVIEKVRSGTSKGDIKEQLLAVGWSEDEADEAYARALIKSGVPIPNEGTRGMYTKKSSVLEVILNLFSFILLGVVVTALGMLFFNIISYFFPVSEQVYNLSLVQAMRDAIHYATAALIIGFPLYYMSMQLWFRKFDEDEGKVESKLTRWITYLVLLVAAVTMVGDLIAVLYTFLQGEATVRFFLKGITLFSLAGAVFGFYLLERKRVQYHKEVSLRVFKSYAGTLMGVIVVGITFGFMAAGTPDTERVRAFDAQRSSDLESTAQCVAAYTEKFEALPEQLSDLRRSSDFSYCDSLYDPETGMPYEYRITTPLTIGENGLATGEFELCANFALATISDTYTGASRQAGATSVKIGYSMDTVSVKWYTHTAGRYCNFESVSFKARDVGVNTVTSTAVPVPVGE